LEITAAGAFWGRPDLEAGTNFIVPKAPTTAYHFQLPSPSCSSAQLNSPSIFVIKFAQQAEMPAAWKESQPVAVALQRA
jgi:hypothetical protein